MKFLLPLLLLLVASSAGAAENDAARQALRMDRPLTAHVISALQPQVVQDAEVLVFDSLAGADSYTASSSSPRTFMGIPVNLDAAAGSNPAISKLTVFLAYTGAAAQDYQSLRVDVQLWNTWSGGGDPVFSNPVGSLVRADLAGPFSLNPGTLIPITIPLSSPIPLASLTAQGVVISFQGDTGGGLASSDSLTPALRFGANAIAVGSNALAPNYGYRNASGHTDFNFAPTDARTFGQPNEAVLLQLYATTAGSLTSQSITGFLAMPASPVLGDGSFTVSATGGASGNPVVFSIDPASAAVCAAGGMDGTTISILAAGTCTVLADQAGNATYSAAPQQSLPVEIGSGIELVQDGSFEAGFVPTYWAQASTNYGTPLCDITCGGVGPRTGTYWAWLGGASAAEVSSLEQAGAIAPGPKVLTFYVWWSSDLVTPPDPAATFNVKIDGNTIFALTPATAAAYTAGYTLATVDISAYADDSVHFLRFEANTAATAVATDINLDDVSIVDDRVFGNGFGN